MPNSQEQHTSSHQVHQQPTSAHISSKSLFWEVEAWISLVHTGREYQVIGRRLPSEADSEPKLFRMRLFAPNPIVAKSRFWYFLTKLKKIKKSNGEIVAINEIHEKKPNVAKVFGIWLRYDSRSGTHNMYKEYREVSRVDAVEACYMDMAARHRARFSSIQIIRVAEVANDDVRRPNIKQLLQPKLKFPVPHRVNRSSSKQYRSLFIAKRPSTFY
jgi:large subunit ribosomal protein L18Ae